MIKSTIGIALAAVALAGCANLESTNLIFGQQETVGLGISGSGPQQGADLTLGYKSTDIAVVPVATKTPDGQILLSAKNVNDSTANSPGGEIDDAFSTLGQFELNVAKDPQTGEKIVPSVGLGKFFATGVAAQYLADGFRHKLAGSAKGTPAPAPTAN